jgi:glycosyltransferase involved in cell wall biosynthesis
VRVALVSHSAEPSGAELAMLDTACALASVGVEVLVMFLSDGPLTAEAAARGLDVTVVRLPGAALGVRRRSGYRRTAQAVPAVLLAARDLSLSLTRRRVDLVETNTLKAHVVGSIAARLGHVPCVWRLRDIVEPPHVGTTEAMFLRALARTAHAVIAVSEAAAASLRHPRTLVVPSSIRTDRFASIDPLPSSPPTPLRIASISRLAPWKGQDIILEAAMALRRRIPVEVVVAGSPLFGETAYRDLLQKYASDSVHFVGHVSDVAPLIASAHVIAHTPRMPEPFGKVVVGARAAGRIALAAGTAGPTEILGADFPRWLMPVADSTSLTAKLEEVVGEWSSYASDALRARAASSRYDVRLSAERAATVYERVVQEAR